MRPIAPPPAGQRISSGPPPLRQSMAGMPPPIPQAGPPPMGSPQGGRIAPPASFQGQQAPPPMQWQQTMPVPMRPPMDTNPMARSALQPLAQPMGPPGGGGMPSSYLPHAAGTIPTLYLVFNGQRIPITKEQFIVGRGLKTSDLAIKDGNISRKHAAIIYHNGAYYIKDLGSVNGVEFGGKRIDSKRIDEADVFHICDYELRFTYR